MCFGEGVGEVSAFSLMGPPRRRWNEGGLGAATGTRQGVSSTMARVDVGAGPDERRVRREDAGRGQDRALHARESHQALRGGSRATVMNP